MDRMQVCGTCDPGSIPGGSTRQDGILFHCPKFIFKAVRKGFVTHIEFGKNTTHNFFSFFGVGFFVLHRKVI